MAINITNSQGTKVYLCPAGTDVSTAAAIQTAYASAKLIGCIQDIGSLTSSRTIQEYSCLSSDEIAKSFGSLTLGNFTVGMLYDAADTAGQSELKAMFDSNSTRVAIIGLSDGTFSATTSPTCFTFTCGVSSVEVSIQKDNAVLMNATIELASVIKTVAKDTVAV